MLGGGEEKDPWSGEGLDPWKTSKSCRGVHVGPQYAEGKVPGGPIGALGKVGNSTGYQVDRDCMEQEDEAKCREGGPGGS